ncbi:MAG: pimeloyl-CoA dehydrogenase large subunit, partial [Halioglobus sp.]|nr:pimeloyl-CoA dehydrogenase large subunit [Halioglobus sp.]
IQQTIQELRMDVAAYMSGTLGRNERELEVGEDVRKLYFRGRASSIYGGSNEIQKNITAKYVLGLKG